MQYLIHKGYKPLDIYLKIWYNYTIIRQREKLKMKKSDINTVLKNQGIECVKIHDGSMTGKCYTDWNGKRVKGIRGGSVGPTTVTSAASTVDVWVIFLNGARTWSLKALVCGLFLSVA